MDSQRAAESQGQIPFLDFHGLTSWPMTVSLVFSAPTLPGGSGVGLTVPPLQSSLGCLGVANPSGSSSGHK